MDPNENNDFPFLTREMLDFGNEVAFGLNIDVITHTTDDIEIRGFTRSGAFTFRVNPAGNGSIETTSVGIPDVPIALSAFIAFGETSNASAHVTVTLTMNGTRMQVLAHGLISRIYGISYPHQPALMPSQERGEIVEITGVNPAAGGEVDDAVPDNEVWEILGIAVTLATDANAADRTVRLRIITKDGHEITRSAGTTHQANETQQYDFVPGGTTAATVTNEQQEVAIPAGIILQGGSSFATVTTNKQAGDNYGATLYHVRRYYQPSVA